MRGSSTAQNLNQNYARSWSSSPTTQRGRDTPSSADLKPDDHYTHSLSFSMGLISPVFFSKASRAVLRRPLRSSGNFSLSLFKNSFFFNSSLSLIHIVWCKWRKIWVDNEGGRRHASRAVKETGISSKVSQTPSSSSSSPLSFFLYLNDTGAAAAAMWIWWPEECPRCPDVAYLDAGCSRKGCEGGRAEQYRMLCIQLIFMCLPNVTTEIPKASAGNRPCIINIIPFCPHVSMPPKWTLYNTQHFPTDRLMALRLQTLCTQSRISRASFFLSFFFLRQAEVRSKLLFHRRIYNCSNRC